MSIFDLFKKNKSKSKLNPYIEPIKSLNEFTKEQKQQNPAATVTERRKELRHATYLSTTLKQNDQDIFATIVNLSRTGLGIVSGKAFNKNEMFEAVLSHTQDNPVMVKLAVQSCRKMDDEYLIGTRIVASCSKHSQFFEKISASQRPSVIS